MSKHYVGECDPKTVDAAIGVTGARGYDGTNVTIFPNGDGTYYAIDAAGEYYDVTILAEGDLGATDEGIYDIYQGYELGNE